MNLKSPFLTLLALSLYTPAGYGQAGEIPLDSLRRDTPSGEHINPASFFRMHGYVTLSYTANGPGLGQEVGTIPKILVNGVSPRTGNNESGFRNDAALFVGGEPFDRVGTVLEIHFVGNALDPVLTEAKFTYQLADADAHEVVVSGGRFWWPFGIHNKEWFSSLNNFPLMSVAGAEVVPAHYNEVGLMVEGASFLSDSWGINYVGAVGNGVPSFDVMPNVMATASDADSNRSVTGRFALVRLGTLGLELGMSAAAGGLRQGLDRSQPVDNVHRYDASFTAFGPDLTLSWSQLALSAYYYHSSEKLTEAPQPELARDGFTIESSYRFPLANNDRLEAVRLHARVSRADEDNLAGGVYRRLEYSGAMSLAVTSAFDIRLAYILQKEDLDAPTLSNNILSLSFTAKF
ncbi:MAG: hypothetical protein GWP44_04150 [Proteobacteria bacterium]|nr:hypothetical protein [Pseudomonadota bacterium]